MTAPGRSGADNNVRRVVRILMTASEMSAEAVAKDLGISRASMYERLSGRRVFTVSEVATLSEVFGVPPGVFLIGPSALIGPTRETQDRDAGPARESPGPQRYVPQPRSPRLKAA